MAFLPYVPIGLEVIDRVYKLITRIRANKQPSKNAELAALQEDVAILKEAVELQTGMLQERDTNLSDCVDALERQVRGLKLQVWVVGLAFVGLVIHVALRT
jgi:hypothetical protein